ncbi:MAG: diguanylate cyclase [Acidimicrobiales bacterium]
MGRHTHQSPDELVSIFDRIGAAVPGVLFCYERTPDARHRAPYLGDAVREVFGLDPGDLADDVVPLLTLIHPDDRAQVESAIDDAAERRESWDVEVRMLTTDGEYRWFGGRAAPEFLDDGSVRWYGQFLDIQRYKGLESSLRANEVELAYQESFHRLVAGLSADLIATGFRDLDRCIDHLLAGIGEFFGVGRAYLYEFGPDLEYMANTHEWCRPGVRSLIEEEAHVPLEDFGWWRGEVEAMVDTLHVVYVPDVDSLPPHAQTEADQLRAQGVRSMFCVPVHVGGRVAGFFGVDALELRHWREDQVDMLMIVSSLLSGALERHRLERDLVDLTVRDALTGLHNRRYLMPRLTEMCEGSSRRDVPFTVAMIDLDHFKDVNDTYGHVVGDAVLVQFAELLASCTRSTDVVCRFGGEEFVVAFPSTNVAQAGPVVDRMLAMCRAQVFDVDGLSLSLTTSAGVVGSSELPSDRCDPDAVLAIADHRLYLAKHNGRDQMVVSDELDGGLG